MEYVDLGIALYYDLPVYRDTYQLVLKVFECTRDFSKAYKYTLGQDMKRDALQNVSIWSRFWMSLNCSSWKYAWPPT